MSNPEQKQEAGDLTGELEPREYDWYDPRRYSQKAGNVARNNPGKTAIGLAIIGPSLARGGERVAGSLKDAGLRMLGRGAVEKTAGNLASEGTAGAFRGASRASRSFGSLNK